MHRKLYTKKISWFPKRFFKIDRKNLMPLAQFLQL